MRYSTAKLHERSMDDILDSIRKAVSDEIGQEVATTTVAKVIELTQMVQDDGSIVDVSTYKNNRGEASMELSQNDDFQANDKKATNQDDIDALFNTVMNDMSASSGADSNESKSEVVYVFEGQTTDTTENVSSVDSCIDVNDYQNINSEQFNQNESAISMQDVSAIVNEPKKSVVMDFPAVNTTNESLVSDNVVQESLAAFSKLTEVVQSHSESSKSYDSSFSGEIGNKSVEGLMRELLIPLLKDWLDSNLPSLVKWIVTEEIQKILKQYQK